MIHKILLVDDDQMIAEDFQRTIAGESDLELTWASSGAKAISEVQKNPRGFSVIVMDYLMPDMSGAETTIPLQRCWDFKSRPDPQ